MAAYFFASPVDIDIKLEGEEARKQVDIKLEKDRKESCPIYYDGESIIGQVQYPLTFLYLDVLKVARLPYVSETGRS